MLFGRWTNRHVASSIWTSSRYSLCLLSASLLTGCGDAGTQPTPARYATEIPGGAWTQVANHAITNQRAPVGQAPSQPQVAALMPIIDAVENQPSVRGPHSPAENPTPATDLSNQYWSFDPAPAAILESSPLLIPLPPVEETVSRVEKEPESDKPQAIAQLLPPQEVVLEEVENPQIAFPASEPVKPIQIEAYSLVSATDSLPVLQELSEQEKLLTELSLNSSLAATGVLTNSRVNELAKAKIQQAYAMASRGALYVARQELVEVLRMISRAKDAWKGAPERATALAAGMRALREAQDFAPRGTQLEAELEIDVICASHRTPLAKYGDTTEVLPNIMLDRYLRYAQLQLASSVSGEPAGSMALHALGKISSQLGRVEPDNHRLADRQAVAFQQAALLAHNQNYLAAHELGVLLATSGHYVEAQQLFVQVAAREPNAVVYRNLARVQEKLGQPQLALASRDQAQQLSTRGATGTNDVHWVAPDQFSSSRSPIARYTTASRSQAEQLVVPGSRPAIQSTARR